MPPFEVLLPIGALALYLFDSALLLYSDELVFVRRSGGWDLLQGPRPLLFGRRLCLPNPFTPYTPQFRVRWSDRDARTERDDLEDLGRFIAVLKPLQLMVVGQLVLLLVLPVELFVYGTGLALLILFAAYYGLVVAALVYAFVTRRRLNISGGVFALLAFDSLACSPFAINLVRKLAMRRGVAGNPLNFAQHAFGAASFAGLVRFICERVREEQQHEDHQLPRWAELEAYRRKLLGMLPTESARNPAANEVP